MSRHRMKTVSYDDDYEDDDGYDSPDPEEQEYLEQCTKEVLGQLRSGEPSVTATRDEIQEALWHYYNDVEKSVNYLRGKKAKEIQKKQTPPATAKPKGPSPDDVVVNAQSSAKGFKSKPPAAKSAGDKKAQGDLASGMGNLSVAEKVNVKSKNLDVLSEYKKSNRKKSANFVVIGHVDAGKSTLMGRLLADLKAVDQRTLEKYKREAEKIGKGSFALAWVLDQGTEERARGVTIDIATNKFETEKTAFTIVDAPGHRDFVPNMIAGASQADFAVLVIDSSTGKFESGLKGQTKEHALLVRSMGVQKIIVAVNKMDSVQWDKARFDEIEQQVSSFLTAAGFQPKNIAFVPCSGIQGDNITRRSEDPNVSWYTGRTLVDELETSERYSHALDKPLRMTIADVFRGSVQNPLSISGRIEAGSLQVGDELLTMPSGEKATIRSLEVDGDVSDWAVAGQNVVLNLANIDPVHLRSGDVICHSSSPIQNITSFTTKVLAFEHLMPSMVDIHRGRLSRKSQRLWHRVQWHGLWSRWIKEFLWRRLRGLFYEPEERLWQRDCLNSQ